MRDALLRDLAARILKVRSSGVTRVAIDGVDGAGKTHFADELAPHLQRDGRSVIRTGVDSFHNPREIRYRLGKISPEGFYRDSYNYPQMIQRLLAPLSPGGDFVFRRAAFDHRNNSPIEAPPEIAEDSSILVFDGIFLHRPELRGFWDFSVFLDVDFSISIPRGAQRGEGSPDPLAPSNHRYVEGQRLYFRECQPWTQATLVIDNRDLQRPYLTSRRDR